MLQGDIHAAAVIVGSSTCSISVHDASKTVRNKINYDYLTDEEIDAVSVTPGVLRPAPV